MAYVAIFFFILQNVKSLYVCEQKHTSSYLWMAWHLSFPIRDVSQLSALILQDDPLWYPDLIELGYPGFRGAIAHAPAVQAVLASIDSPEFHQLVIELDKSAAEDVTKDGARPQLMDILALNDWIKLSAACMEDPQEALAKLRKVHGLLADFAMQDAVAADKAKQTKAALAKAFGLHVSTDTPAACFKEDGGFDHPLITKKQRCSEEMKQIVETSKSSHDEGRNTRLQDDQLPHSYH